MNILLINHYAGSPELGMEYRPYYLAKEWIKQGHQVCVVGGSYSHLRKQQPNVLSDCVVQNIDGITYCWLKTPTYNSSGLKRFWSMIIFVLKLYLYRKKLTKILHPHVVIASSTYPIDVYPAHYIAKKSNAKLCFELHDLWPMSPMEIGRYSKYHPFIMLMQAGENHACRYSDVIVSLLGNAKQHLVSHGMHPDKFHHIINGFSMDEWKNTDKQELPKNLKQLLDQLKEKNIFVVGYAGGINPSNAMKTLIEAAITLKEKSNLCFLCVGKGNDLETLKQMVSKNTLDNVHFYSAINKISVPDFLEYCDVLYVGFIHSQLHQHGIAANKITDYMLASKPIILSADVENETVDKVGCGISVPAEDSQAVKNAILTFMEMYPTERKKMGERGREYALRELNYENLAKKIIQVLS